MSDLNGRIRDSARASPGELALLVLLGLSLVGGGALVAFRKSEPPPPPIRQIKPTGPARSDGPSPSPSKVVVVDVGGMVITPGVYQLTDGSRIKDAIAAAGGAAAGADVTVLNLAAVVADGQKIVVPRPGQSVAALDGSGLGSTGPPAKVNLNTATVEQLDKLPSIGPVLAQRILAFRQQKGRFTSARQLQEVEGVGQKKYDQLKDLVTI